jgi:hypothetical protein
LSTTTASAVVPAQVPAGSVDQPFFTGGDWITLAVGLVAAMIAILAWRAALPSAVAAENAVAEQRTANALTLAQQQRDEERNRRPAG